jgi:hypothetical protein
VSRKRKWITIIVTVVVLSVIGGLIALSLSFSSWLLNSGFIPLPDEERYQYIDEIKDKLDYESSGEVLKARYDNGDGVFSPSFFMAEVESAEAYAILTERTQSLPNVTCSLTLPIQTRCDVEGVVIQITNVDSNHPKSVILEITDTSNGRRSE